MSSFLQRRILPFLLLLTFLTRLPFIFDGYGSEEDSYGLVVNAWQMKQSGHYIMSRAPGHPLQEYIYLLIYSQPAWVYNLCSLLMSVAAVGFFYAALRRMKFEFSLQAALMFCFTPVFWIAGTYTIDFAFTLAMLMASFYFLTARKLLLSGIFLGMAIGCRITCGIFILPWAILLWNGMDIKTWFRHCCHIALPMAVLGILFYVPAFQQYGKSFFDYNDQFPYPPLSKVIYKATLGVFGLLGMIALLIFSVAAMNNFRKKEVQAVTLFSTNRLLLVCLLIVVLHVISYLRLPQKSGYMLPAVPFVILMLLLLLTKKQASYATALFALSPLILSINIADSLRGAKYSPAAVSFHVSGQEIFLDPLSGPVFSEQSKRKNKMSYCDAVASSTDTLKTHSLFICGWWYNELLEKSFHNKYNPAADLRFYVQCTILDSAKNAGENIYYLPEQNLYNDQMFRQSCTDSLAKLYPVH